jgi:valyl-tRNA synthetase
MSAYEGGAVREARAALVKELGIDPAIVRDNHDGVHVRFGLVSIVTLEILVTNEWALRWAQTWRAGMPDFEGGE